jgi:hypothetical protein
LEPEAIGELTVEPLDDGGMGSFRLAGKYGKSSHPASEVQFQDLDGVLVIATLYVDPENRPREVCIWKVNFAPLIQIPAVIPRAKRYPAMNRE